MNNVEKLPLRPFTKFCMSIGLVPTSYLSGLTIEEQLLWFCSYLEKNVIPAVNNNAEAVEELQALYIQLKNYVDHYFDNLDIQEEVNTKLDEMAESGELAELISQYLESQAVIGFNTNEGLSLAQNLADGSFARTYGKITYNDGKGAFYKIRTRINSDVPDGDNIIVLTNTENLVAEKMPDFKINEIETKLSNNWIDPLNYGAIGDGITDDYEALQACINQGNVRLSSGTYYVSEPISIPSNRIFDGGNRIIKPSAGNYAFIIDGESLVNAKVEISLKNIQLRMPNGGNGIKIKNGYFIYLDNINITDMVGNDLKGIDIENGFNYVISNSRIYGGSGYTGQIGLNIVATQAAGEITNITNFKFDSLLIQNLDYGVKTNFQTTANMISFDNTGFSNCNYCFYLDGYCMPMKISNTRMEGGSRQNKRGFYIGSNIIVSIDTLNAYDIDYVIANYSSSGSVGISLYGDIVMTGTATTPKKTFVETSKTSSIYLYGRVYLQSDAYNDLDSSAFDSYFTFTNCTEYQFGSDNTGTDMALSPFARIIRKTTSNITNVRGLKGCECMIWCDTAKTIASSTTSQTSMLSQPITMVPYKLYKIKLLDTSRFTVLD